jgi:hypothetical protein
MEATCERAVRGYKPTIPPLGSKFWPLRTAVERAAFSGPADWRSHSADACVLAPRRHAGHVRHAPFKQLHGPSQPAHSARKRSIVLHGPRPIALTAARSRHVVLPGGTRIGRRWTTTTTRPDLFRCRAFDPDNQRLGRGVIGLASLPRSQQFKPAWTSAPALGRADLAAGRMCAKLHPPL